MPSVRGAAAGRGNAAGARLPLDLLDSARQDLAARHEVQHPESIDEPRVHRNVAGAGGDEVAEAAAPVHERKELQLALAPGDAGGLGGDLAPLEDRPGGPEARNDALRIGEQPDAVGDGLWRGQIELNELIRPESPGLEGHLAPLPREDRIEDGLNLLGDDLAKLVRREDAHLDEKLAVALALRRV